MNSPQLEWDYPDPFVIEHTAEKSEVDGYGHINNSVYVQWMDRCVWAHCEAVGLGFEVCQGLKRGFAAVRHEIDYILATYEGDEVSIANWVTLNDGRLRAERRFQIIRHSDAKTVLRAHSKYICTSLTTGMPSRIPKEFHEGFCVLPSVAEVLREDDEAG